AALSTCRCHTLYPVVFFFTPSATPDIYPLSLHDALPIYLMGAPGNGCSAVRVAGAKYLLVLRGGHFLLRGGPGRFRSCGALRLRSEEHTSELQSRRELVCRLLLEKKKKM